MTGRNLEYVETSKVFVAENCTDCRLRQIRIVVLAIRKLMAIEDYCACLVHDIRRHARYNDVFHVLLFYFAGRSVCRDFLCRSVGCFSTVRGCL